VNRKSYLCAGGAALVVLLILFSDTFCNFASLLVGAAYPMYATFQALQEGDAGQQRRWLTYWLVSSIFLFTDHFNGAFDMLSTVALLAFPSLPCAFLVCVTVSLL
jgi:hypothetical protein